MNLDHQKIPVKGLAGLRRYIRYDLLAGFSVSLIAMPLCLGIALASGVPPIAGLFTAIVGGILASRIAGSNVTISGPAAGLIVITLSAVESLGGGDPLKGYPYALAAIVVAGAIVAVSGLFRVGKFGDFFPSAAVHGMLAAIGIIIMVKQSFTALGVQAPKGELLELIAHLPLAFRDMNPEVFFIALAALLVLVIHPRIRVKWIRMVPAPLLVLLLTIPMAHAFDLFHEHHYHFMGNDYVLGPKHLVNLPDKISDGIVFPDFGLAGTGKFWFAVISFALVSGIESLLSAKAVDALDPWKRQSNLNRDLMAMGGGSAIAGLVGGLPMISEIVRSSANINNGARTQWANFFHGCFLLVFLLLLTPIIEQIPMSALAAMLVFTGFRLASPKEFRSMYQIGPKQFTVFVATIVTVIATDLLIGIGVGIVLELVLQLAGGVPLSRVFKAKTEVSRETGAVRVKVHDALIFSNYLSLKSVVMRHGTENRLVLDFAAVRRIDHTVMHNLHLLELELEKKGVHLELSHMGHLHGVTDHPLSDHVDMLRKKAVQALSERQKDLWAFAQAHQYSYMAEQAGKFREWDSFTLLGGYQILKVESRIEAKIGNCAITFADLQLKSGAYFTEDESRATYMHIMLPQQRIPYFRLDQETFVDRIRDNVTREDIDFEAFQLFSDKFLLRGQDESSIREFFTPERISFFESHLDYEFESNGSSLLVRSPQGLLSPQALEGMLEMTREWMALVAPPAVPKPEQQRSRAVE